MKESIGSTQLFIIVITIILIFAGIMGLTISRSNAFAIKDSVISAIENNGGMDLSKEKTSSLSSHDAALDEIVEILATYSYRQKGVCNSGATGYDRSGKKTSPSSASAFCIERISGKMGNNDSFYYKVTIFYTFGLPILADNLNFTVKGETKPLYR